MDEPTEISLVEAIADLRTRGYDNDFSVTRDGLLRCNTCTGTHGPHEAVIDVTFRFEGASDPGDEAAVYALRCARCGARGVLVAAYGPAASPEEAAAVSALRTGAAE